jgi:hypothetical protein
VIGFRHADSRYGFLWEGDSQPTGRWNAPGDPPTHYFCDTPDGAWAEFLRHEEITDADDLATIRRAMWAVDLGEERYEEARLPLEILTGGEETYEACRAEARRVRERGSPGLSAPSAALLPGGAHGWRVDGGLQPGPPRNSRAVVLFGSRPDLVGWRGAAEGRPAADLLSRVRYLR